MSPNLLLVSSSRCHPYDYLDHCESEVRGLFDGVSEVVFVPYARPGGATHDEYTVSARERFGRMGFGLRGVHEFEDPAAAIGEAQGVFIGGGNTFVLLKELYRTNVLAVLRERVLKGMPYMGTSAGSNVAGLSIGTSNDMPIAYPPSFEAMGVVPFNINPHYPAAPVDPTHRGESRQDRLQEFHVFNDQPVMALHEDGMLRVRDDQMTLSGERPGIWFRANAEPLTVEPGLCSLP